MHFVDSRGMIPMTDQLTEHLVAQRVAVAAPAEPAPGLVSKMLTAPLQPFVAAWYALRGSARVLSRVASAGFAAVGSFFAGIGRPYSSPCEPAAPH